MVEIVSKNTAEKKIVLIRLDTLNASLPTPALKILILRKPSFFRSTIVKPMVNETTPNAPICMRHIIIICPNVLQFVHVSNNVDPVTQEQDTHVKSASKNVIFPGVFADIGKYSSRVPKTINTKRLSTIIFTAEIFLNRFGTMSFKAPKTYKPLLMHTSEAIFGENFL
jgi:hypothetical protein